MIIHIQNTGRKSEEVTIIETFSCDTSANAQIVSIALAPSALGGGVLRYELYVDKNDCVCVRTFDNLTNLFAAIDAASTALVGLPLIQVMTKVLVQVFVNEKDVQSSYTKLWNSAASVILNEIPTGLVTVDVYGYTNGYRLVAPGKPVWGASDPSGSITAVEVFHTASNADAKIVAETFEKNALTFDPPVPFRFELSVKDNVCYCYRVWKNAESYIGALGYFAQISDEEFKAFMGAALPLLLQTNLSVYAPSAYQEQARTALKDLLRSKASLWKNTTIDFVGGLGSAELSTQDPNQGYIHTY